MLAALFGRTCSVVETRDAASRLIALLPPQPSAKTRVARAMRRARGAFALLSSLRKRTLPDVELRRMFIAICNELQAIGARWGDRGRTCHGSASPMDSPR